MKLKMLIASLLMAIGATGVLAQGRSSLCYIDFGDGYYEPFLAAGGATAWEKGSSITLYIVSPSSGGFTSGQITNIETALSNWSSAAVTNLQITNSVVTSTPSSFPSQYILVQFGSTSGCGDGSAACTAFNYNTTTGYPTYSTINVSTSVGTADIGALMAHEMGHTYIIADCLDSADCDYSLTLMDPTEIFESSPTSPLCCDLDLIYAMTPEIPQGTPCTD